MTNLSRILPVGLLLVCAGLCAVIAFEVAAQMHPARADVAARFVPPNRATEPGVPASSSQQDRWFRLITARPIFSPDRRPIGADARNIRGLPRLTGIIVTDSHRVAIFAAPAGSHPIVAEAGSHVGSYAVRDITDSGVTLTGTDGTAVIRPAFDTAPPPAPKAAMLGRSVPQAPVRK